MDNVETDRRPHFASMTISEATAHIADTDRHSGGAAAAAISAAHAAATAQLVAKLNGRRKKNPERARLSQTAADALNTDCSTFIEMADRDSLILNELMDSLANRDQSPADTQRYLDSLLHAANSSIEVAEAISQMIDRLVGEAQRTPLFLVSDIGASASLAVGSLKASIFTAIANLQFLRDEGADVDHESLMNRVQDIWRSGIEKGAAIDRVILARYTVAEGVIQS